MPTNDIIDLDVVASADVVTFATGGILGGEESVGTVGVVGGGTAAVHNTHTVYTYSIVFKLKLVEHA